MSKGRRSLLLPLVVILVLIGAGLAVLRFTGLLGRGHARSVTIAVDLPYQGSYNDTSTQAFNAMKLYLQQVGGKVGDISVSLFSYDDASASSPAGDTTRCAGNAEAQAARADVVAVIGPAHVACARVEAKALAKAGMLLVSPAVTNPGLTKAWGPDEPGVYTFDGLRSFARVVPTDDAQALSAAGMAKAYGGSCLVLNDGELYGRKLAERFVTQARSLGVSVVDGGTWDRAATSYRGLFAPAVGVTCVFLAGNFDNNGAQLVADKVAALGDNDTVKLIVPDGFGVYPSFLAMPEAEHAHVTWPGMPMSGWKVSPVGGNPYTFQNAYHASYHSDISTPQAIYGVLALQVVLEALARSNGTRAGVRGAVFGSPGVTVPAKISLTGEDVRIDPGTGDASPMFLGDEVVMDGRLSFGGTGYYA